MSLKCNISFLTPENIKRLEQIPGHKLVSVSGDHRYNINTESDRRTHLCTSKYLPEACYAYSETFKDFFYTAGGHSMRNLDLLKQKGIYNFYYSNMLLSVSSDSEILVLDTNPKFYFCYKPKGRFLQDRAVLGPGFPTTLSGQGMFNRTIFERFDVISGAIENDDMLKSYLGIY